MDLYDNVRVSDIKAIKLPAAFGQAVTQPVRGEKSGLPPHIKKAVPPKKEVTPRPKVAAPTPELAEITASKSAIVPKETVSKPGPVYVGRIEKRDASGATPKVPQQSQAQPKRPDFELSSEEAVHYGRILEARNFKDYDRGNALIEDFMEKYPGSTLLRKLAFLRGDFLFFLLQSGHKELLADLEEAYRSAIEAYGNANEVPRAYLNLARAYRSAGKTHQAADFLNILIGRYRDDKILPIALLERGRIHLNGSSPEMGFKDFQEILQSFPDAPQVAEARYGIARYLHDKGIYDRAENWLKEIEVATPHFYWDHPEYLSLRAQNYLYLKMYDLAREQYFKALNVGAQQVTDDLLLTHIADTYFHESDEEAAKVFYTFVTEGFPATEGFSIAQLRLGEFSSGVTAFKTVQENNVGKPIAELALLKMATVYYEKGKHAKAMESIKDLVAMPANNEIRTAARQVFYKAAESELKGRYEAEKYGDMVTLYHENKAILAGKISPNVQFLLAKAIYRMQDYAAAIAAFRRVDPYDLDADGRGNYFSLLAALYRKVGDNEKAVRLLEKNKDANIPTKDAQRLRLLLADIHLEDGRRKEAYAVYESLAKKADVLSKPEKARVHYSIGRILNTQELHGDAVSSLKRSVAILEEEGDQDQKDLYLEALAELGESYRGEGNKEQAIQVFKKAFDAGYSPEKEGYWDLKYKLAESYLETGKIARAEKVLREILEEGDEDLQPMAQIKVGSIELRKQLGRLSVWRQSEKQGLVHVNQEHSLDNQ
jgi:FimV-like protein